MFLQLFAGAAIVGLTALVFSGGSSGESDSSTDEQNPNEVKPVLPPANTAERKAGRVVVCTCYRGGAQSFRDLARCVLKAMYPDAPENKWGKLVDVARDPNVPMTSGTRKAVLWVMDRAEGLLRQQTEADRQRWCGEEEEVEPEPGPDRTTPPPGPSESDRIDQVRDLFRGLDSGGTARGGTLHSVEDDSSGLYGTSKKVLQHYGASASGSQQLAYAKIIESSPYNRALYARDAKGSDGAVQWQGKTTRPAYLPRHEDAKAAYFAGRWPRRTITAAGNRITSGVGNRHGWLWLPELDRDALNEGIVIVKPGTLNPPVELLGLLEDA